jgi:hypothetical protein
MIVNLFDSTIHTLICTRFNVIAFLVQSIQIHLLGDSWPSDLLTLHVLQSSLLSLTVHIADPILHLPWQMSLLDM